MAHETFVSEKKNYKLRLELKQASGNLKLSLQKLGKSLPANLPDHISTNFSSTKTLKPKPTRVQVAASYYSKKSVKLLLMRRHQ